MKTTRQGVKAKRMLKILQNPESVGNNILQPPEKEETNEVSGAF